MKSNKTAFAGNLTLLKKLKTATLISSAVSLIVFTTSTSQAASKKERCAGVTKAGLNDCASAEHICAGMNTDDGNDSDWIWLPTGTCKKIIGAHLLSPKKDKAKTADSEATSKDTKKEKKKT